MSGANSSTQRLHTVRTRSLRSGLFAAILFAISPSGAIFGAADLPESGNITCPAPGAQVAEPYRWYPSLDLARIPFHTGAGPWGPRAPITAPAPPSTRRTVRVTSAPELAAAARSSGTLIVVDADLTGHAVILGDVTDVDIVVPPGRRVGQLTVGRFRPPSTTQRVRIRGTTPGVHSGGLVGAVNFLSNPVADIIIDGVDLNGADGKGGGQLWKFAQPVERLAVVNVRGHSVGPISGNSGSDIVIAGNRLMSGARPREVNGYPEGWGIRAGDRIVIYDNRIDGTRYHRIRVHPEPGPPQYAWVANNTFVDPHEARILSVQVTSGRMSLRYAAVWAVCNRVYAHSTCMTPSFDGMHADYAILTSNIFFGSITEALQRSQQAAHGPGRDYLTGNTFSAWEPPPPWEAPGDPTSVPLPPVDPSRYNATLTFQPCPAP